MTDELAAEQAYIDRVYERLDAAKRRARELADAALRQRPGATHQALFERDVLIATTARRLAQLETGDASLVFGRIDNEDGERLYIGRVAVADESNQPLLVDWRAPVAEPFYRATGRHPMGLVRRRHLHTRGRKLLGIDDEVFDPEHLTDEEAGSLVGEGALLASLERARTGRMGEIVATIQREQDEIIRAPLPGLLVVQGGPGTGKTAVALHRAAYLLYTHRFPLERMGVLVVGPNPIFVRYIEQVLPALGETGAVLTTAGTLVTGIVPSSDEGSLATRVKGDARMAKVIGRAVRSRERPLPRGVSIPYGVHNVALTRAASREIVTAARRGPGGHNARRRRVERLLERHLWQQYQATLGRAVRAGLRRDADAPEREAFAEAVMSEPVVREALERMWPRLSPQELLHDLFGSRPLINLAARDFLSDEERAALYRPRSPRVAEVAWTEHDVALLDEAAQHLGPKRGEDDGRRDGRDHAHPDMAQRVLDELGLGGQFSAATLADRFAEPEITAPVDAALDGHPAVYGHLIVDEAQDVSPMQWRAIGRRCPTRSMTIVGDLAQASGAWRPPIWSQALAPLGHRVPPTVVELSVNYRTPAQIMELATGVLEAVRPKLVPPRSVRRTLEEPVFVPVTDDDLAEAVLGVVRQEADAVAPGRTAVIAASSMAALCSAALAADARAGAGDDPGVLDRPIAVLTVNQAKGLEFDSVVVVEPASVAREHGLEALYVALTRCTRRLTVVYAEPLPQPLADSLARA